MKECYKNGRIYYYTGRLYHAAPENHQGQRHGVEKEWHDNERLKSETPYHQGQLHGTERHWHYNGQLRLEVSYQHEQRHGITRVWEDDGKLILKRCYLRDVRVTEAEYEATQ